MGRLTRRIQTGRKKKQDTPQKMSVSRRMGLKKQTQTTIFETVPEDVEVNFPPVQKAKQSELDPGAGGSEEVSPLSLVIDTSYTSESSVLDSSNSPPSPEVFREERYDASTILAENSNQDINQDLSANKNPSNGCKLIPAPTSDRACKLFKKQVRFRSPLFSEKSRRESTGTPKRKIQCHKIIPKQAAPTKNTETETLQVDEDDDVDGGTFFDFSCDSERDSYFQKMRERYTKLKNAAVFPLTAVSTEESAP